MASGVFWWFVSVGLLPGILRHSLGFFPGVCQASSGRPWVLCWASTDPPQAFARHPPKVAGHPLALPGVFAGMLRPCPRFCPASSSPPLVLTWFGVWGAARVEPGITSAKLPMGEDLFVAGLYCLEYFGSIAPTRTPLMRRSGWCRNAMPIHIHERSALFGKSLTREKQCESLHGHQERNQSGSAIVMTCGRLS